MKIVLKTLYVFQKVKSRKNGLHEKICGKKAKDRLIRTIWENFTCFYRQNHSKGFFNLFACSGAIFLTNQIIFKFVFYYVSWLNRYFWSGDLKLEWFDAFSTLMFRGGRSLNLNSVSSKSRFIQHLKYLFLYTYHMCNICKCRKMSRNKV